MSKKEEYVNIPVVITVYEHCHGADVGVHPNEDEALKAQVKTALEFWKDRADSSAPDNPKSLKDDEIISAYFDDHESEWWTTHGRFLKYPENKLVGLLENSGGLSEAFEEVINDLLNIQSMGVSVEEDPDLEGCFYFRWFDGEGSPISYQTEAEAWFAAIKEYRKTVKAEQ